MKERLKSLRKALQLTQKDFAEKLNIKRPTVATYENGSAPISDRTVADICRVFSVSESWLRDGVDPMFQPPTSVEAELPAEIAKLIKSRDTMTMELILFYLKADEPTKKALMEFIQGAAKIFNENQKSTTE